MANKVIILGLDGATWTKLDEFLAEAKFKYNVAINDLVLKPGLRHYPYKHQI